MPRLQVTSFRLDAREYVRLLSAAQAAGVSPSAWCRRLVLEQLAGTTAAAAAASAPARFADAAAAAAAEAEPLSRVVAAKLTASQYFDLDVRAKAAGFTIGAYLRRLIQGQPPTGRWPLARKAIVELSRVGNNLNQLVKLAHEGKPLPAEIHAAVQRVLAQVRALRNALLEQQE
ncbi:MAG TPA: plasmid mobilization relaxosome protein MobC [Thermoanaerobaculia bacterium]|nr:plasmid mobilization relaxosome protein MobC [Thermoanaerobaculia bacterium]